VVPHLSGSDDAAETGQEYRRGAPLACRLRVGIPVQWPLADVLGFTGHSQNSTPSADLRANHRRGRLPSRAHPHPPAGGRGAGTGRRHPAGRDTSRGRPKATNAVRRTHSLCSCVSRRLTSEGAAILMPPFFAPCRSVANLTPFETNGGFLLYSSQPWITRKTRRGSRTKFLRRPSFN
jgi:hypothetical protein